MTPELEPNPPLTEQVSALYARGLYVQAYRLAVTDPEFDVVDPTAGRWHDPTSRRLAVAVRRQVGQGKRAALGLARAFRRYRHDAAICANRALQALDGGPLHAWRTVGALAPDLAGDGAADWHLARALVLAVVRDHSAAAAAHAVAAGVADRTEWLDTVDGILRARRDDHEGALRAAERALQVRPWYRPAIEVCADALIGLARVADARDLLREADDHMESGAITLRLAQLHAAHRDYAAALAALERTGELWVAVDDDHARALALAVAETAYLAGDPSRSIALARTVDDPVYKAFADRLEANPDAPRVELAVELVPQHHNTCAPATLTALSRYFGATVEHVEVVEQICYDGTTSHAERRWVQDRGWIARELTVTWDAAVALIDRGVPFAMSTVATGAGHQQAIIGYDARRRCFLVRDPSALTVTSYDVERLLAAQRAHGPRGLVMLPPERAAALDGLALPDAELYDLHFQAEDALARHDRAAAQRAADALHASAPDHRITALTDRSLASYDDDQRGFLAAVERLLALNPDDSMLTLAKLSAMENLASRAELVDAAERAAAREHSDPLVRAALGGYLSSSAEHWTRARRLLVRALAQRPDHGAGYAMLANIGWRAHDREASLALYRLAACASISDEGLATTYFNAAHALGRADEALAFLADRAELLGARRGAAVQTLCEAYEALQRDGDAAAALRAALERTPDDGALRLYAARYATACGRLDEADDHLRGARGSVREVAWARGAAFVAETRGDYEVARGHWRTVVEAEPLAVDAVSAVVSMTVRLDGAAQARALLATLTEPFPHHYALHQMSLQWLDRLGAVDDVGALAERLAAMHPLDPWAQRELGLRRLAAGDVAGARAAADRAAELSPRDPSLFYLLGRLAERDGDRARAREHARAAIEADVDFGAGFELGMDLCRDHADRRELAELGFRELDRQPVSGAGISHARVTARGVIAADEVLDRLLRFRDRHPALWDASHVVIAQLVEMRRLDDAAARAREATEQFPLVPAAWRDLAKVRQESSDLAGARRALEQALAINPGWIEALHDLADVCADAGDLDAAERAARRAVARDPLNAPGHGFLAHVLRRRGDRDGAIAELVRAAELDPQYTFAWDKLSELAGDTRARAVAAEIARAQPRNAAAHLACARVAVDVDGALAALDRALACEPTRVEICDTRAELLAGAGRFDDALAACAPPAWDTPPLPLRGRAAWIKWKRGDRSDAIRELRALVADNPSYGWGWRTLLDIVDEGDDAAAYERAAREAVANLPNQPAPLGHLGSALQRLHRLDEAADAFRAAIAIERDYRYARFGLFDSLVDSDPRAALEAFEDWGDDDAWVLQRRIHAYVKLWQPRQLWETYACLLELRDADLEGAWQAVETLRDANLFLTAMRVLNKAVRRDDASDTAIELWSHSHAVSESEPLAWWRLWRLARTTGNGARAAMTYVRQLAALRRVASLTAFAVVFGGAMRRSAQLMAAVCRALADVRAYRRAVWSMRRWRELRDVEPAMLDALATALRALRRDGDAAEVSAAAVARAGDGEARVHRWWLALDAAVDGDTADAERWTQELGDPRTEGESHLSQHVRAALALRRGEDVDLTRLPTDGAGRCSAPWPRGCGDCSSGPRYAPRVRDAPPQAFGAWPSTPPGCAPNKSHRAARLGRPLRMAPVTKRKRDHSPWRRCMLVDPLHPPRPYPCAPS